MLSLSVSDSTGHGARFFSLGVNAMGEQKSREATNGGDGAPVDQLRPP